MKNLSHRLYCSKNSGKSDSALAKLFVFVLLVCCAVLIDRTSLHAIASTVTGKVIDSETGAGIPGVTVKISSEMGNWSLETNNKGEYVIYEVEPGELKVVCFPPSPYALPLVKRDNYYPVTVQRNKNLHILMKLVRGGTIIGRVFEKNSNTLLKIEAVSVYWHLPGAITYTGCGEFRIDQLQPGIHTLAFQVNGFGMREIKNIEILKNETKTMDFFLDAQAPTKVEGQISCISAEPLPKNVQVTLLNEDASLYSETYTDENGNYSFKDVIPGKYKLLIIGLDVKGMQENKVSYEKNLIVFDGFPTIIHFKIDCNLVYDFI